MKSVSSGGDYAKTEFKILSRFQGGFAHLQARPMTGRMHQIRIHAADSGCPLLGDSVYGGATEIEFQNEKRKIKRVMLHARSLEFLHPITGKRMKVEAPLPDDFLELRKWLERSMSRSNY
jgi:23S rRNA-/tRNA-specific pseudouridylate synthase